MKQIRLLIGPTNSISLTGGLLPSRIRAKLVYREGNELRTFVGTLADLPGAEIAIASKEMTVTWSFGKGEAKRDFALEMTFRYSIGSSRNNIHLSYPRYTLTCDQATPQPELGFRNQRITIVETKEDEVSLYEIFEDDGPRWWNCEWSFNVGDVEVSTQFELGVPLLEGNQAFIWKTPILKNWDSTTIAGLTTAPSWSPTASPRPTIRGTTISSRRSGSSPNCTRRSVTRRWRNCGMLTSGSSSQQTRPRFRKATPPSGP